MSKSKITSDFTLEGRLLGLITKENGKIKALRMATATGEHKVKLSKELRYALELAPGEWIRVSGCQTVNLKKGEAKLKAKAVVPVSPHSGEVAEAVPQPSAAPKPKLNILVCQKSDCCKRGGNKISQALEAELSDRGLAQEIRVKGTGCMKRCKGGPNVVMPDKTRYSRIGPDVVPELLDRHFPTTACSSTPHG